MKNISYKIFTLLLVLITCSLFGQNDSHEYCSTPSFSVNEKIYEERIRNLRSNTNTTYCLRIYVHVIRRSDGTGGQSVSDVSEALGFLDMDFNPHDIYFEWDQIIDYIDDNNYFNNPWLHTPSDDGPDLGVGNDSDPEGDPLIFGDRPDIFSVNNHTDGIDIYLFDDSPGRLAKGTADGVGVNSAFLVSGYLDGYGSYVRSHVISHEMGHVLFLFHTFRNILEEGENEWTNGTNCEIAGDYVCDTPADPNVQNQVDRNNCEWSGWTPWVSNLFEPLSNFDPLTDNIMSYTNYDCSDQFTEGQAERMKAAIDCMSHLMPTVVTCDDIVDDGCDGINNLEIIGSNISWDTTDDSVEIEFLSDGTCCYNEGGSKLIKTNYTISGDNTFSVWTAIFDMQRKCGRFRIKTNCSNWSDWCCIIRDENSFNYEITDDCVESVDRREKLNPLELIKVYPNPTQSVLTIETTEKVTNWIITSAFGRSYFTGEETKKIDISNLPDGIYYLKAILKDGNVVMRKIIKN